jgi:hypothetical protein
MDIAQQLQATEEIRGVKARYFRAVDTQDPALLRSVFADDAVVDVRGSTGTDDEEAGFIRDPDKFVEYCLGGLRGVTSVHHGHCPEIKLTSETTATGIWAMEDFLWCDETSALPFKKLRGWGHYHEEYRKTANGWAIAHMKLVRIRIEAE